MLNAENKDDDKRARKNIPQRMIYVKNHKNSLEKNHGGEPASTDFLSLLTLIVIIREHKQEQKP